MFFFKKELYLNRKINIEITYKNPQNLPQMEINYESTYDETNPAIKLHQDRCLLRPPA